VANLRFMNQGSRSLGSDQQPSVTPASFWTKSQAEAVNKFAATYSKDLSWKDLREYSVEVLTKLLSSKVEINHLDAMDEAQVLAAHSIALKQLIE
jgi:hypothetical protein